tara:strand:- start:15154 stop:15903 length:750 start_codon:yes stop_codon:yes gene_type:complete
MKVTETKEMSFKINDGISEAYEKMLGIEDVVEDVEVFSKSEERSAKINEVKSVTKSDIQMESRSEEVTEDSDDIIVYDEEGNARINEKRFMITQGIANAFRKPDLIKGNVVIKKVCSSCNFHMPSFAGKYPTNCPLCGTPFEQKFKVSKEKIKERFAIYEKDRCVHVVEEIVEGKFKDIEIEKDMVVDYVVDMVRSKKIKNKKDLMSLMKDMKSSKKLPKNVDKNIVKDNFSEIVTSVGQRLRKEGLKI